MSSVRFSPIRTTHNRRDDAMASLTSATTGGVVPAVASHTKISAARTCSRYDWSTADELAGVYSNAHVVDKSLRSRTRTVVSRKPWFSGLITVLTETRIGRSPD